MAHHLKTKNSRFSPLWFLLILLPLFAAVYFYFTLNPENAVIGTYTEARLSRAGKEIAFADADTIDAFKNAVTTGKQVIESPKALSEYAAAELSLSDTLHTTRSYTLYLTHNAKDCFYKDAVDSLFAMNADDALSLLTMDEFDFVYPSAPPEMSLKLGDDTQTIAPSCDSWKFMRADGNEKEVSFNAEAPVFTRTNETISVVFDKEPDSATMLVRNANSSETLFSGSPEKLSVFAPDKDQLIRVEITAHYGLGESYPAYGTVRYTFFINWTADSAQTSLPASGQETGAGQSAANA